jgi:ketosteroid isomerase-like protein
MQTQGEHPMRINGWILAATAGMLAGCAMTSPIPRADLATLQQQVIAAERGFAKTMADRNFAAFQTYLADEAVFFTSTAALRGKATVAEFWKRFYERPEAPFSWEPEKVEVLDSGTLAISFGPVRDPKGKHFSNFQSIWRLEAPGVWRVIFDRGNEQCDCPKPAQ